MACIFVKGYIVLVDDDDLEIVSPIRWSVAKIGNGIYFLKSISGRTQSLHRLIMRNPSKMSVDHATGNTLDNRKINLRLCTHQQNMMNRTMHSNNTSGYRGVGFHKRSGKWVARIRYKGRLMWLGTFYTPEEAHFIYQEKAIELFGEFFRS